MKRRNFAEIETQINLLLSQEIKQIRNQTDQYQPIFDRAAETAFYTQPKGLGEVPTWEPNPAYMLSTECFWEKPAQYLQSIGLRTEQTLREMFFMSREYQDSEQVHRRVFCGQLVELETQVSVTFFLLTVPHSHHRFEYYYDPYISISRAMR